MKNIYTLLFLWLFTANGLTAQASLNTQDLVKYEGYFTYYYDSAKDKIYLEVKDLEKEFLYVYSLSSGIGSNDIGLDRGQLGNEFFQVASAENSGATIPLVERK